MSLFKRRAGGHPAPGAGNTPGAGERHPPAAPPASPARRQPPAPGCGAQLAAVTWHYTSGCPDAVVYRYTCGRREYYDPGTWQRVAVLHCDRTMPPRPDPLDLEYRALCAREDR